MSIDDHATMTAVVRTALLTAQDFTVDILDTLFPLQANHQLSAETSLWHEPYTVPPASSGHNLNFKTFAAIASTSFCVSSDATAANTSTPLPIDETSCLSTVTEADATR